MNINKDDLLKRIDFIQQKGKEALSDDGRVNSSRFYGFRSAGLSLLKSTFGESHPYYQEFNHKTPSAQNHYLWSGIEILKSVRFEVENGWFETYKGLISAEIFSDFLEMSYHLIDNRYKDPAAVMIGSVLEEHLRQLCSKTHIEVTVEKEGSLIPKKADRLNSELVSKGAYGLLDQKNITAWLDLRNKAAHGNYDQYTLDQVRNMHSGVSEFISRNPS